MILFEKRKKVKKKNKTNLGDKDANDGGGQFGCRRTCGHKSGTGHVLRHLQRLDHALQCGDKVVVADDREAEEHVGGDEQVDEEAALDSNVLRDDGPREFLNGRRSAVGAGKRVGVLLLIEQVTAPHATAFLPVAVDERRRRVVSGSRQVRRHQNEGHDAQSHQVGPHAFPTVEPFASHKRTSTPRLRLLKEKREKKRR